MLELLSGDLFYILFGVYVLTIVLAVLHTLGRIANALEDRQLTKRHEKLYKELEKKVEEEYKKLRKEMYNNSKK